MIDTCWLAVRLKHRLWTVPWYHYSYTSVDAACNNMTCSGNGRCEDGECVCDRLYTGEFCQIKGKTYHNTTIIIMSHGLQRNHIFERELWVPHQSLWCKWSWQASLHMMHTCFSLCRGVWRRQWLQQPWLLHWSRGDQLPQNAVLLWPRLVWRGLLQRYTRMHACIPLLVHSGFWLNDRWVTSQLYSYQASMSEPELLCSMGNFVCIYTSYNIISAHKLENYTACTPVWIMIASLHLASVLVFNSDNCSLNCSCQQIL